MIAIVNVSENWGIGLENRLLVSIRADLKRFRELTLGKTVIYGRKTLETFPNGKPLKNRRNLILSGSRSARIDGAEICHSIEELLEKIKDTPADEVFLIGGAKVYEQLLPYCDRVYVTKTFGDYPADRFFPNLDELPEWERTNASEIMEENGIFYRYIDYVNQKRMK